MDLDKIKKEELRAEKIAQVIKDNEKFTKIKQEHGDEVIIKHTDDIIPVNSKDLQLKGLKLGTHHHAIKYKLDDDEIEMDYSINIVDTVAPIIEGAKDIEIEEGQEFDLNSLNVIAIDKVDEKVEVHYESDFKNEPGEYKVKIIAEDSSGNKATEEFKLKVLEKKHANIENDSSSKPNKHKPNNKVDTPKEQKPSKQQEKESSKPKPDSKPKPEPKPKPKPQIEYLDNWARDMHNAVNKERKKAGVPPLEWSDRIHRAARVRAKEITVNYSHTRPDGSSWFTVDDEILSGENIVYGYASVPDAMSSFMDSPGHKDNLLYSGHGTAGYGVVSFDGTYYYVQLFGFLD